jgi:hypothetical protein
MMKRYTEEEEESLRRYFPSEEDRALLTREKWAGGYRWFRSANVVAIEHYRRPESLPQRKAS